MSYALHDRPQHAETTTSSRPLLCPLPPSSYTAYPYPALSDIRQAALSLADQVVRTPVWRWQNGLPEKQFSASTEIWLKLELFQKTGTFKLRGALNCVAALDQHSRLRGLVAVSAGNHAIAVAYSAQLAKISCKVVMPHFASSVRIEACRQYGAEVILAADMHSAFALGQRIAQQEGRNMMHPYDGPLTAIGTGTIGLELLAQISHLDAVVVPIGGGGLCAGMAAAIKQLAPHCAVYGVEPSGADAMYQSFQADKPVTLTQIDTIADSLCAPYSMEYSFRVCQAFVDEVVRVDDQQICNAMAALFSDMKLAVEPAAAVALAGLCGPLRAKLDGKRVALMVSGSNIDAARYADLLQRAR